MGTPDAHSGHHEAVPDCAACIVEQLRAENTRLTRGVERAAAVIDQRAKDCAAEASDCEGATRRAELRSMSEGYRRAAILLRDAVATDATSDNPSLRQPVKP